MEEAEERLSLLLSLQVFPRQPAVFLRDRGELVPADVERVPLRKNDGLEGYFTESAVGERQNVLPEIEVPVGERAADIIVPVPRMRTKRFRFSMMTS